MELRIERIDSWLVDIPTIRPHKLSMATMGCQTLTLVRMTCADGLIGWGKPPPSAG
ncbi:mandelate racemase / muconate lactonizing enzyme, N-terminal domain protein [Serratia marcescens]|nr:mandelate racemase / muconate lactonizing enzyme, N-terminal domain protein [Serratia marcescens]